MRPVPATGWRLLGSSRGRAPAGAPRPLATPGDVEYCRRLVQANSYDSYLVSLFSPRRAREAAWGVRALDIELASAGGRATSQAAAQVRFAYWSGAIKSLYSTDPVLTPVTRVVYDAVHGLGISKTWLRRLVLEREHALERPAPATVADVEKHGERAYACLIHPHLEALGVRDMHADNAARAIGVATAVAEAIRSLPQLLEQRRCGLPLDILEQHNVNLDDLYDHPRSTPALQEAVYALATTGYTRLCGVAELYAPNAPRTALPALLAAVPVKVWLERLERANFDAFDASLQQRSLRVLWRLWRANRRGTLLDATNRGK
ncbi:hypothetical protein LPJ61_002733 [Coemansia biformis]|uniref:Phytoene synthase n=1 Tax=Coemansia biformis TaxID=1286918 RepID=A0A9W7YDY3_9FUNG|nr:hypothetical protein LPJ61_002733 [Coemansia biformis]